MSLYKLQELRKELMEACDSLEGLIKQVDKEHRGIMQFANINVDDLINTLEKDLIGLRAYLEDVEVNIRLLQLVST